MNNLELYIIRHGKTYGNEKRLYCGSTDLDLSKNGIEDLYINKKIYDNIKKQIKFDGYYTTGLRRTNKTMSILFSDNYNVEENLREYNFGSFEMKGYDELKEDNNYISWITDEIGDFVVPNGESKNEYRKRIKKAFNNFINKISYENKKRVVLVCHGGTIGTILEVFYDNRKSFYEWQPECGKGYILSIKFTEKGFKINNIKDIY